jgi:hypothetical protein
MAEKLAAVSGILGGHQIHLSENPQGAEGQIFQIADRRGHKIKGSGHKISGLCFVKGRRLKANGGSEILRF